jgi:hypothetical protein
MRIPILRLAAGALLLAAFLTPAFAQAPAPQPQQPAQPAGAPANPSTQRQNSSDFIDSRTANSQNLAKAEQEDEEYVFRHSDSVRAFAKMFHLSPEAASMVFWSLNAVLLFVFVG